jgi:hypothetical protein
MESDRSDSSGPITKRVYSLGAAASATDTRGKHRIQAELKRIEQEARFLEVSFLCLYCFVIIFWAHRQFQEQCFYVSNYLII